MYLLYSLVLSLLFFALLPYFLYQAARRGKYSASFKERLGRLPASLRADTRKTIWVHAVSVGEFLAARSLIARLRSDLPATRMVVSTTTQTGQHLARSQAHLSDAAIYFPFDWKFSVRRALDTVNPSVVIIMETELWPNFLRECRQRGVVTVLANGRISARSFRRYKLLGRPFRRAIENFSLMVMQSDADAERARQLGAPANRVRVCGNLKYDLPAEGNRIPDDSEGANEESEPQSPLSCDIDHQFALSRSPHLIVAGSTEPGEEEVLLASLRKVRKHDGLEDARLLLAPRRPERFDEVARLVARSGFSLGRRSESPRSSGSTVTISDTSAEFPPPEERRSQRSEEDTPDIILLDTIGELASIYRFAAVVFIGGSLVPRGGHNIIEPAAFAKPVIVGPHTENFRQIVSDFAQADALIQIGANGNHPADEITRQLTRLLSESEYARAMGERGRDILLKNRGATDCTVAMIREVLKI